MPRALRHAAIAAALVASLPAAAAPRTLGAAQAPTVVVDEIRVQGNYRTTDEEVVRLAGVAVGDRLTEEGIQQVQQRLSASGAFADVEVRKRFRSLVDAERVALVILVRETLVPQDVPLLLKPFDRAARQFMFLPILDYTEGYGFTYGARVSLVDWMGGGERLSAPFTWGGTKRAALEIERAFTGDRISRVSGGGSVSTRENPHFELDDHRVEAWARADHELVRGLTAGGGVRWSDVEFGDLDDQFTSYTADLTVDTRSDPSFPRNAVYATAAWEAMDFQGGDPTINRYRFEARGYVGLVRQTVLSLRALHERADRAQPGYAQFLLGGGSSLRGHPTGAFAGDQLAAASIEFRAPLDSPLGRGKAGVTLFYDVGAVYDVGTRLGDTRFHQGAGAGVFLSAPFVHLNLAVGADLEGGARVHFSTGFIF